MTVIGPKYLVIELCAHSGKRPPYCPRPECDRGCDETVGVTYARAEADRGAVEAFGREIALDVADELDECGQFRVAVVVDGKERWAAHFTDKAGQR